MMFVASAEEDDSKCPRIIPRLLIQENLNPNTSHHVNILCNSLHTVISIISLNNVMMERIHFSKY